MVHATKEVVEGEWATFPGGELEGKRPKALCPACRARVNGLACGPRATSPESSASSPGPQAPSPAPRAICFQCYRVELERQRALQAAGQLDTASEERFQEALPFLPVNRARLHRLKGERAEARQIMYAGVGRYVDKRRQAQIAARHALQRIVAGLGRDAGGSIASLRPGFTDAHQATPAERERMGAAAIHAAELQLPDAWLPFVVSR
jgi:hypothetical protein